MGYHLNKIPKGIYGEWSKVEEELAEYEDAKEQGSKIMMIVELSDLYGALRACENKESDSIRWLEAAHYMRMEASELGFDSNDLKIFASITKRAFESGERK